MEKRKRIIHLLSSNQFSGAENVVCQIINIFKNDENIEMFYCSPEGQIQETLKEQNIAFIPIKELSVSEVKRVIHEVKPDILHAHDMRASFFGAMACRNVSLICHIHNNNFDSRGLTIKALAFMFAAFKAKHIFYVSESSYKGYYFHKLFKRKSSVLYNIIDINMLIKKMDSDNKEYHYDIVYLGRLTTQKNPMRLLKVIREIVNTIPNIKIAIIGTGDLEQDVRNEALKLQLNNNVFFLGFQSNPYKILHDSKVMIMTSLWEGTPMCILEAMSLGVPVVSTPTDGVKVVVKNGQTGYLSDDDGQLVDYCCRIVRDEFFQKELSNNSVIRATKLMDIEDYKERILMAYKF